MPNLDWRHIVLRRYLTFDRFVGLLTEGLFVPKASLFKDHWEAMLYDMNRYLHERDIAVSLNDGHIPTLEDYCIPDIFKSVRDGKKEVYVSCWNGTSHECVAMWELYGKSKTGIIIETNATELISAFESFNSSQEWMACLKELKYVNPGKDSISDNGYPPLWDNSSKINTCETSPLFHQVFTGLQYKHKSYNFEQEYRLLAANVKRSGYQSTGLIIPLSKGFLKRVILQPKSTKEFEDKVRQSLQDHGFINCDVQRSILDELPNYE